MIKYFFLFFFIANTALADISELSQSICKTLCNKHYCTAFCYSEDKEKIYLISAGHCHQLPEIDIILSHTGKQKVISGKEIFYRNENIPQNTDQFTKDYKDIQIIEVIKTAFEDYPLLKPVKWAANPPKVNELIWSYGAADGSWPTAHNGYVLSLDDWYIRYVPSPKQGRSGSPLFNSKFELIGLVTMSNGANGSAFTTEAIRSMWNDKTNEKPSEESNKEENK